MGYRIAIVGATGSVGQEILNILSERNFPVDTLVPLASSESSGTHITFGDNETLKVRDLKNFSFRSTDIALFAADNRIAENYAPKAARAGAVVIDNSSHFRMDNDVPLIVPEVNGEEIFRYTHRNIIANPNCSTTQLVVALKPLHDLAMIKRVVVTTYQSVSGAGRAAMDELFEQTKAIYIDGTVEPNIFSKQIAFNVIPHIDSFLESGETREEWKMSAETNKILDPDIKVIATCVRVPVFIGHAESVIVEFRQNISVPSARNVLVQAPGIKVVDDRKDGGYTTPADCVGDYATYVSLIRADKSVPFGLALWVVSDNLRNGAALNAVQIAEELINGPLGKQS